MIHGVVKVWRFRDGQVERANKEDEGAWVEATVTPTQFSRHVRHTPVRAFAMNEAFIVLDRDGNWQSGRKGDYIVLDDGYLRIETEGSFAPQHHQIAEDRLDLSSNLTAVRSVLSEVLRKVAVEHGVTLDENDSWDALSDDLADAAMTTVATL